VGEGVDEGGGGEGVGRRVSMYTEEGGLQLGCCIHPLSSSPPQL
jgi:hypothetical protein